MPELPEVETMVGRLRRWKNWRVRDVTVDLTSPRVEKRYLPGDEYNDVLGQSILEVCRRGKFIIFQTSSGTLLCHNAMTGYWDDTREPWTFDYVEGKRDPRESDVRVSLRLEPGWGVDPPKQDDFHLRFHDARKFGSLHYLGPGEAVRKLSKLGPDALDTDYLWEPTEVMDEKRFIERFANKKKHPIKERLLNQELIAGVGNIYAAEALWAACIDPRRAEITEGEASLLLTSIRAVLELALERNLDYAGLNVYRRKECTRCKSKIQSVEIKGRNTWYCPECQE